MHVVFLLGRKRRVSAAAAAAEFPGKSEHIYREKRVKEAAQWGCK